jgi:subtilisin family serine protease
MRRIVVMALACVALLPAQAAAAVPMKAVIVHLAPTPMPPAGSSARDAVQQIEQEGRRAQAPVLAQLAELRREGHVRHVRPLWIADAVALSADAGALAALEARPDVQSIEADAQLPIRPADAVTGEPGIASTGAPGYWARGVDGRGITVGVLDTGVDLTHPELALHYRGGTNSWFDPYGQHPSAPVDMTGHGSEVTGVIVAGAGIGMAPGARFIAARAFDDTGASTASAIHLAFQWLLDPDHNPATHDAPNVVNLSWGARQACNLEFQPDLQALRSAHILPVAAAGNDGQTIPQPPGLSPDNSPANLPEAFAVGALQSATAIAPFSSAGPSSCSGGQFPALVAPGTGIRSTSSGGFDATNLAGTSFSAPHVAGALALLLQVAPQLTAVEQANLLTQSADDLGAPGADSIFGAGALDLVASARSLHSPALDFDPPVLSGAASTDTTAQVRADDVLSAIATGEWWADGDPGIGAGQPLAAADGTFDSHGETLVASTTGLAPGPHLLGMRARDTAGNWSTATTLALTIPAPPPPPSPAVPEVTAVPVVPLVPVAPTPLQIHVDLDIVATDGFERGLGAWPRRVGAVAASRAAAISGRRGLRAKLVARAPSFVQRHLPRAADEAELAFDLNPRTFSSAGTWVEVAVITSASGQRLASVDLRSFRGGHEIRLSTGAGAVVRSQGHRVGRRPVKLALSLDAAEAGLVADGARVGRLARGAGAAAPGAIVLGPWRGGPAGSTGHLDIDGVTVREAPAAS